MSITIDVVLAPPAGSTASSPVVASLVRYPVAWSTSRNSFRFMSLSSTHDALAATGRDSSRRQREDEAAAVSGFALDPDPAAVELDESFREREPEPCPLSLVRPGVGLLELLEDPLLVTGCDSRPGVGDRHLHLAVGAGGRDDDAPACRGELDRVREQVEDHLAQPPLVAVDQVDVRRRARA